MTLEEKNKKFLEAVANLVNAVDKLMNTAVLDAFDGISKAYNKAADEVEAARDFLRAFGV